MKNKPHLNLSIKRYRICVLMYVMSNGKRILISLNIDDWDGIITCY